MAKREAAEDRVDLITRGNLQTALITLALPAMAMMIGNLLFEIVDMFWIGKTTASGIAAVSVSSYVIWALRALATITSGGTTTLICRSAGSRNWGRLTHWFFRGFVLAVLISVALMLVGFLFLEGLLYFMALEEDVIGMTREYLSIFYISLPLVFLFVYLDNTFRSLGDIKTPAVITAISLVMNAILDPFLIFGWAGAPQMGVAGAALATALSQAFGLALMFLRLQKEGHAIRFDLARSGISSKGMLPDLAQIVRIGAPIALTGALFSIVYIFLTRIVAGFGTIQIAAMGLGLRWEGLAYYACLAASAAVAAVVGQNLGTGKAERAREAVYIATKYLLAFTLSVSVLFIFGGEFLASVLTQDQAVMEAAARYLRIIGFFEAAMALHLGLEGAFLGSGDTWPPFLISVPFTLLRIPVAWFMAVYLGLGIEAVWWAISTSTLTMGILTGIWFFKGSWAQAQVRV
jgi:putative MATE family efflux protein